MISLSGYGATGPEKGYVSYGPPQVALSGMSSLTGYKDDQPRQAGFSYGDPNGGVHGTFAVMCALLHRAKTGNGQFIDLSQREACAMLLPEGLMEYAMNEPNHHETGTVIPTWLHMECSVVKAKIAGSASLWATKRNGNGSARPSGSLC